jgi:MFS family permease
VPRISPWWPFPHVYYGWAIVVASFAASFAEVPVNGPVIGVFITPIQEELGWSRFTLALGFTTGSVVGALSSAIAGRLVDRYGARVIVTIAGVLIFCALVGLSAIQEPWQFWALFGLGRGSAQAGVGIGTSVAVGRWFYRRRGRMLAIKAIGHRIGQVVLPLGIVAVMAAWSWRAAFIASAGIAALLLVLPAALLLRRQPEDFGLAPDGAVTERERREAKSEVSWTLREARRTRAFWLIVAFTVGGPFVLGATNFHMVANFQDRDLSAALAVSVLSVFAAVSALSLLPLGLLLERIQVRHGAMMMALLLIASMAVIRVADTYAMAMAFAVLFGLTTGLRGIVDSLLVVSYFGRGSLGTIRGFVRTWTIISTIGPLFAGYTRDVTGSYSTTFLVFGAVAALMLLAMAFATPPKRPGQHEPRGELREASAGP